MNPHRILFLQSTSEIGGTDITLLRTLQVLNRSKYAAHVVLYQEGPFAEAYRSAGAKVHIVPSMRKLTSRKGPGYLLAFAAGYLPAVFEIKKIIHAEKIELVHTNTIHNFYGFLAARLSGVPHLWHIREIVVQSAFFSRFENFLVRHFSDCFIVMDKAIAAPFLEKGSAPPNMVMLYDGVDLEEFNPRVQGTRIRAALGIDGGTPLVGTASRLDPWKGIEIFLEAAAKIHAEMPAVKFWVCGGEIPGHEGYEARLRRKAEELGISGAVYFTGWRFHSKDMPEVYAALDISVQSPLYPEPYGLASIEAMASAVPVVGVNQGGTPELCEDGKTAFLVPPGDSGAVAAAVLKLLKDPELLKKTGEEGRRRAEKLFDRRRCVEDLEKIYQSLLGNSAIH